MLVLRAGLKSSYGSLFLIGVFMSVWRSLGLFCFLLLHVGLCWVRVIGKSTSFGQELLPTLLTQHQQQQERPTLPNAQDRFLLPVHRVWWSGLSVCFVARDTLLHT